MKELKMGMLILTAFLLGLTPGLSWAATATASATVSATIPSAATIGLVRDDNTVGRSPISQIVFDRVDSADPGVTEPNPGYMYAPYRSEGGLNWHVAEIAANGSTLTLSVSVSGAVGQTQLSSVLKLWSGGFFEPSKAVPITGTASTVWESAEGWQRQLSRPFIGTVPFVYQLNIAGLPSGGPFTGTITFTLVTT